MITLVEHLALWLMQAWIELCMMHIWLTSKALTHQKMYQCVRYTAWKKTYASKLALGGFQCSGLSVPDFPELQFHRTRIFRYEKRSTIFTTNQPFSKWGEVFGDSVIASAIVDRIVHHCEIVKITGQSYRIKGKVDFTKEDN